MHFDISKMFLYIFVVLVLLHMVQYYLFDQAEANCQGQCQQSMSTVNVNTCVKVFINGQRLHFYPLV